MTSRLEQVFGPYLRPADAGGLLTPDGRNLEPGGAGYSLAQRLIETDPARYADEIIKLMKPFCRPFDIGTVRARLTAAGGLARPAEGDGSQAARRKGGGGQMSA